MKHLDNKNLLAATLNSAKKEKQACLELINYLSEVDKRAAYIELNFNSLYHYVSEGLGYSHDQTYLRVNAVKIINKIPEIKQELHNNQFSLSTLSNVTTLVNEEIKLEDALRMLKGKTKNEAKEIIQEVKNVKPSKKIEKKKITIELTDDEYVLLNKVCNLKNQEAKEYLLEKCKQDEIKLEKSLTKDLRKNVKTTNSRNISVNVKRKVLIKANYKCEHLGCTSLKNLEYAHIMAYSKGGKSTDDNLKLLCHAHHKYETFQEFGTRLEKLK